MKPNAIPASELDSQLTFPSTILLDIREEFEYEDDHLEGLHIPMAEVRSRVTELEAYSHIIICCTSGKRAIAMNYSLSQMLPAKRISYLEGGLEAYRKLQSNV